MVSRLRQDRHAHAHACQKLDMQLVRFSFASTVY